jgi:hypothetical protein
MDRNIENALKDFQAKSGLYLIDIVQEIKQQNYKGLNTIDGLSLPLQQQAVNLVAAAVKVSSAQGNIFIDRKSRPIRKHLDRICSRVGKRRFESQKETATPEYGLKRLN